MRSPNYRNTQTQVKHEILAKYLDTWGGIIVRGLSHSKRQHSWHFVYVDCFAYKGKYAGDQEDTFRKHRTGPVYGSPIIGIRALDKLAAYASALGMHVVTNSIVIEKDISVYRELKATLQECGLDARVQETVTFSGLKNGEIALVNDDAIALVDRLITYSNQPFTWAFYLLDPFGASGIPYDFVKKVIVCPRHDVMINFIYEDFLRKSGMALNQTLEPKHRWLVDLWKKAFGNTFWDQIVLKTLEDIRDYCYWRDVLDGVPLEDIEIKQFLTDEQLIEVKERSFVYGYQKVLESMDPDIAIKLLALKFPDKERTMFYLFLTTHDPTGALQLNQILHDAKLLEYELRFKLNILRNFPTGQLSFFDPVENIQKPPKEKRPSNEEVAQIVYQRMHDKILTRKQVYASLTDTLFFPGEIDRALKWLKHNGKLNYNDTQLRHQTQIHFMETTK